MKEQLRTLTLMLVEEVLLLDRAIFHISAERFDGQPILFSDSAMKLEAQLNMTHRALEHFNFWAKLRAFNELTAEEICDKLRPEIDKQVARRVILARGAMLAVFGEEVELHANFDPSIN